MRKGPTTLGVIVGNRGFFPSHLCSTGRKEVLEVLAQEGFEAVALDPEFAAKLLDFIIAEVIRHHEALQG